MTNFGREALCTLHVHIEFWEHAPPPLRCTTQSAYAAAKCSVRCGLVAVTCRREDISEHDVSRTAAEEVIG